MVFSGINLLGTFYDCPFIIRYLGLTDTGDIARISVLCLVMVIAFREVWWIENIIP